MDKQAQEQVDSVMEQLSGYISHAPWDEWMAEVFEEALAYTADALDLSIDEVLDYIDEEDTLGRMAHAHVFEHFVTTEENESGETVLQAFLRQHVDPAKLPKGYQYLQALADSKLGIWEVVDVKGKTAKLKLLGQDTPIFDVNIDIQNLPKNVCIATRVLALPNLQNILGFGLLPLEREDAIDTLDYLAAIRGEILAQLAAEQPHLSEAERQQLLQEELNDLLFYETFASWIGQGFEE